MKKCFSKTSFPLATLPQERVSELTQKIDVLSKKLPENNALKNQNKLLLKTNYFEKKELVLWASCRIVMVFTYELE